MKKFLFLLPLMLTACGQGPNLIGRPNYGGAYVEPVAEPVGGYPAGCGYYQYPVGNYANCVGNNWAWYRPGGIGRGFEFGGRPGFPGRPGEPIRPVGGPVHPIGGRPGFPGHK